MGNKIGTDGPGTALPFGPVQHTPGPWFINRPGYAPEEIWIIANHPEVGEVSHAVVRSGCGEADELGSMEANARLIAAAPDLLSIAQRWLAIDGGSWHPERQAADRRELEDATRAVIARALNSGGPTGQAAQAAVSSNPGSTSIDSSQGGV